MKIKEKKRKKQTNKPLESCGSEIKGMKKDKKLTKRSRKEVIVLYLDLHSTALYICISSRFPGSCYIFPLLMLLNESCYCVMFDFLLVILLSLLLYGNIFSYK